MFTIDTEFYRKVSEWVDKNSTEKYFILPTQQTNNNILEFCSAVLDKNKIAVIITNVGSKNKHYPLNLRQAMNLSDDVLVYESSVMAMDFVIKSRAEFFVNLKGGVIWIQ
jgi:hypothetical protein